MGLKVVVVVVLVEEVVVEVVVGGGVVLLVVVVGVVVVVVGLEELLSPKLLELTLFVASASGGNVGKSICTLVLLVTVDALALLSILLTSLVSSSSSSSKSASKFGRGVVLRLLPKTERKTSGPATRIT